MNKQLLGVEHLNINYRRDQESIPAVTDVSFVIGKEEIFGLVGESGCGKTSIALALLGLLSPAEAYVAGSVTYAGTRLDQLDGQSLINLRGREISMIFQDPYAAWNPVMTIGQQIAEVFLVHQGRAPGQEKINSALREARIEDAERVRDSYPHQLSGGLLQRSMIAMALSLRPRLVIADEPTTALDVTLQKDILQLLLNLKKESGCSLMLITHDISVVAQTCSRLGILYAGQIVEIGPVREILKNPCHPYTRALVESVPAKYFWQHKRLGKLPVVPGNVPEPGKFGKGCRFYPRCPERIPQCETNVPPETAVGEDHKVRCYAIRS